MAQKAGLRSELVETMPVLQPHRDRCERLNDKWELSDRHPPNETPVRPSCVWKTDDVLLHNQPVQHLSDEAHLEQQPARNVYRQSVVRQRGVLVYKGEETSWHRGWRHRQ
jgi:hypothetical protein